MSYDVTERSVYEGQPVECYRIAQGSRLWTLTSADREVTIAAGTFTPGTITRSSQDFSSEDTSAEITIRVPRISEFAAPFIAYVPESPMYVSIYRFHRGAESEAIAIFIGKVVAVSFEESEAVVRCAPITHVLTRRFPYLTYQTQCNWMLYSLACGVDPNSFKTDVTVTTVDGAEVVSNDFLAHASGWFNGGFILRANGTRRFIVDHVGNTVTLMSPFEDLEALEEVQAYAGCQKTEADCAARFANLDRHLGFARIPYRNPHESGVT